MSDEEKRVRLADLALTRGLFPYVRPFAWMLVLSTLLVFLVTGFELLLPLLTQKAIDGFILTRGHAPGARMLGVEITTFRTFGILFAAVVAAGFLLDFGQTLFMEYTGQKIILNLRCRLFEHMTRLPVSYFDTHTSGRLVARVAGDIENMNEMFTSILVFIFKDLVLMIGVFVILYGVNPRLAGTMTLLIPLIGLGIHYFSGQLREIFRTLRQKLSEINHRFSEGITGIKVIQTSVVQNRFVRQFSDLNGSLYKAAMDQIKIFAVFMPLIGFAGVLATAMIIWHGSFLVEGGSLTIGELVAFLSYMKLFFRPLRELSEKFNLLQSALASAERVITVLDNRPTMIPKDAKPVVSLDHLEFKDINFSYVPDVPVLKHVSFSLERGKSLGIVGQTGSGKSSIINLITGFYQPDSGSILVNGQDQSTLDIRDLRAHMALVMQDPILFSGTVRGNIAPGTAPSDAPANEILEGALKQGRCDFLFKKFSGLDTHLGEAGRPLSSGEKQLVCIARAFAFNPDLIIFDEATSYMDSQSETRVHEAMNALMRGRLAIMIAHRLSTIRACDQILVIRQGQIVERGSHEELLALGGEYARLLKKELTGQG